LRSPCPAAAAAGPPLCESDVGRRDGGGERGDAGRAREPGPAPGGGEGGGRRRETEAPPGSGHKVPPSLHNGPLHNCLCGGFFGERLRGCVVGL